MKKEQGQRLKKLRNDLNLSQEYIAEKLGLARSAIVKIESGQRNVHAEELAKLSEIYGVSTDYIVKGDFDIDVDIKHFARSYEELNENDREEIKNIIRFKKRLKKKLNDDNR